MTTLRSSLRSLWFRGTGGGAVWPATGLRKILQASTIGLMLALPSLALLPLPLSAATSDSTAPAVLLANTIQFDGAQLIASGSVEVLQGTVKLTAERIIYDRTTGELRIEGPIRLADGTSNTVLIASSAELDQDLRNGILLSARAVIDRKLQLAAARLDVVDGRYLRMQNTVASTCEVCASRPVPLWELRAREVIHDSEAHQLYFSNAHLRIADVPVFWLPKLRVPDPSLKRATGFLIPEIRTDSTLGTGVEIPYFMTLGDHRDLTISPYFATKTTTLNLRYRQAYAHGTLQVDGALSRDDTDTDIRAYMFARGNWDIGHELSFGIDLRATSDIAYLADYGIFEGDYLPSALTLTRYRANEALDAQLIYTRSLRDAHLGITGTLPQFLGEFSYERMIDPRWAPGRLSFGITGSTSYRASNTDVLGYDVLRLGTQARWTTSAILPAGIRVDTNAALLLDAYFQQQNSAYSDQVVRVTGATDTRLSWPLRRSTASGASELLEPLLHIGWSGSMGDEVPNTDSQLVEFDEGNLLTLSRFPGADRRDTGLTAAAGLRFSHYGETAEYGLTLGRVLYLETYDDYSTASGLSRQSSDWLIGAGMRFENGLALSSRALLDTDVDLTKWETRLELTRPRYDVGATYSYVIADALEARDTPLNELGLDGSVKIAHNWTANATYLHDFNEDVTTRAGFGLQFENDCARVSFSMSRRFWDTNALDPTTRFSFSVGFGDFSDGAKPLSACGL